MIQLTIKELTEAAASGAIGRFFACELTLAAWKANRKTAAACEEEIKAFQARRDLLVKKYDGKLRISKDGLDFPDEAAARAFAADWEELLAVEVEVPGETVELKDIVSGALQQADARALRPFLSEE